MAFCHHILPETVLSAPNIDKLKELKDNLWIDLALLYSSSYIEENKLVISYQYTGRHPLHIHSPEEYLLRIALRNVGHKIERKRTFYGHSGEVVLYNLYYTSVTGEESGIMSNLYNDYVSNREEEFVEDSDDSCSDSDDSSEESDKDCSDDPSSSD
jgi:hypothetical protein